MIEEDENVDNPDIMSPGIAILGYGMVALITFFMFYLAQPVTG